MRACLFVGVIPADIWEFISPVQQKCKLILTIPNVIFTGISMASWPRLVVKYQRMLLFSCFVPSVCQFFSLTQACNPNNKAAKSFDYVITCAFSKIFFCNNPKIITEFKLAFAFDKMSDIITTCQRDSSVASLNSPIC